jgi:hypothetical protein
MSIDDNDSDAAELISHREFICGSDVTETDVEAYDRGELVAWRVGGDGVQWYRHVASATVEYPEIHGVAEEAGLDDYERAILKDWAERLRRAANDGSDLEDDTDES